MSDLLIKNLELPKEDRIQLSVYPNGKVINHSSFTDTTLLSLELHSHGEWHTGTPTEEGWYLIKTEETIPYHTVYWKNNRWLSIDDKIYRKDIVLKWQKI